MSSSILRRYIVEVLAMAEVNDARVPTQLLPKKKKSGKKDSENKKGTKDTNDKKQDEIDEMNVVANIAGYTGPLGAGADDMGEEPVGPGGRVKKNKKNFVRWK